MFSPLYRYKCHKECVQNAPPNCGFSERNLRKVIDDSIIQHALGKNHFTRRFFTCMLPFALHLCIFHLASDSTSPTPTTPISAPGSPALQLPLPGYVFNSSSLHGTSSVAVSESIYSSKFCVCNRLDLARMRNSSDHCMI